MQSVRREFRDVNISHIIRLLVPYAATRNSDFTRLNKHVAFATVIYCFQDVISRSSETFDGVVEQWYRNLLLCQSNSSSFDKLASLSARSCAMSSSIFSIPAACCSNVMDSPIMSWNLNIQSIANQFHGRSCVISGFRHGVNEILRSFGIYAA